VIEGKGMATEKKNKFIHLPKIAQHYIKSLISFNKHDNIVEQIIKEKMERGNRRRQKNSEDLKKGE